MSNTIGLVVTLAFIVTMVSAWLTHIITTLLAGNYLLLIAGALIPPVGIIHGVGIIFGVDW